MRKKHAAHFKAKVAIEAIQETKTMSELSSKHGVHRVQIQKWKSKAITALLDVFASKMEASVAQKQTKLIDELYKQIGQLKVENDWLKKKSEVFNDS